MAKIVVCQKAFASLHGVSMGAVQHIDRATSTSIVAPKDMQGRYKDRPSSITPATPRQVKEHIQSFPIMKLDYSWKTNRCQHYFSPILLIQEMHQLYQEKYESGSRVPCVKYHYYSKILNEDFNFSFRYLKSDTCGTCEEFRIKLS